MGAGLVEIVQVIGQLVEPGNGLVLDHADRQAERFELPQIDVAGDTLPAFMAVICRGGPR